MYLKFTCSRIFCPSIVSLYGNLNFSRLSRTSRRGERLKENNGRKVAKICIVSCHRPRFYRRNAKSDQLWYRLTQDHFLSGIDEHDLQVA